MLPTTSAIWSSLMLLGLPMSTASPIAGQGDPTTLQCGRREPGEKRLATCRADANFNPNSMPARMAYGWALIEAQRMDHSDRRLWPACGRPTGSTGSRRSPE
jgi:hypothetical protein